MLDVYLEQKKERPFAYEVYYGNTYVGILASLNLNKTEKTMVEFGAQCFTLPELIYILQEVEKLAAKLND